MSLYWAPPAERRRRWWHRFTNRWVARWRVWRFRRSRRWVEMGWTTDEDDEDGRS